jgi:hypothetical protein
MCALNDCRDRLAVVNRLIGPASRGRAHLNIRDLRPQQKQCKNLILFVAVEVMLHNCEFIDEGVGMRRGAY